MKVLDLNLRSKWVSFGKENSLWLELAAPTVVDSVAVAFRKVIVQCRWSINIMATSSCVELKVTFYENRHRQVFKPRMTRSDV